MMCLYRSRLLGPVLVFSLLFVCIGEGAEPLHVRIDAVLAKSQAGPSAPMADDAEFLRRISLDLTGRIPSVEAARKFLADTAPDKRQRLVQDLLDSPASDRHLAKVFDIMFMERRPDKHVKSAEWDAYLLSAMKENKPYNQIAREILAADGVDPKLRAPVKFYLDREDMAVHLVTRDTARVFFGRDIECAQCHDHPLISDYEQSEYYGMLAFLDRSSLFQADKKNPAVIAEKAEGDVKFKSVFTGYEGETRPRLPGEVEIPEPVFKKGEEYQVKPAKNVRPVPKFSRREKLAELATAGTNAAFNKNIANRLWAVMMGRGLVEPVDLHHSENPPSSPELLDLLTVEFVAMKYDIKGFLKEIALSNTYQRSFRMPESFAENLSIAQVELPKLQGDLTQYEKQVESFAKQMETFDETRKTQTDAAKPLREKAKTLQAQLTPLAKKHEEAKAALAKVQSPLTAKVEVAKLLIEAAKHAAVAAQNLPSDKSLTQASAAMQAQSTAWQQQVATLQKQFDQQAAATKKAEMDLAAVQAQEKQVQTELAKVESLLTKAESEWQSLRDQKKAAEVSAEGVRRHIGRLNLLTQYAEAEKQLQQARQTLAAVQTEVAATQAEAARNADAFAVSQKQFAEAKKAQTESEQALAAMKGDLAEQTQVAELMGDAIAQLEAARKHLPDDEQIAAVVKKFESARDSQTDQRSTLDQQMQELQTAIQQATAKVAAEENKFKALTAVLKTSEASLTDLAARQKAAEAEFAKAQGAFGVAETAVTESWTKQFRVAEVQHLSPEQLAWSVLEATGQVSLQQSAALAEWNKKHADLVKKVLTPEQQRERVAFIEQTVQAKLQGQVARFMPLFAANAGQPQHEFFATVDQALFFSNGNDVLAWLRPSGDNLTARVAKLTEPQQLAEELYLSILTRRPTAGEVQDVAGYLDQRKDERAQALQEMAWALLTSAEFRFQH